MEPAPVLNQPCFCNGNQQNLWPDTKWMGVWLEQPTFTYGQLYVRPRRPSTSTVNKSVSRKNRNVADEESYEEVR